MRNLAVLISNAGSGTNLQAIIDAIKSKKLKAKITVVISSDLDAYGLIRAQDNKIPTEICERKEELLPILKKYNPDLICLAGWKLIVPSELIKKYKDRILNIHPGLIPDKVDGTVLNPDKTKALWNRGKLTDSAIQNFFDNHSTYAGSTLHFLTDDFDFGPVLGRDFEKIKKNDTVETLYTRLKKKENKLYVNCLIKLCK